MQGDGPAVVSAPSACVIEQKEQILRDWLEREEHHHGTVAMKQFLNIWCNIFPIKDISEFTFEIAASKCKL